MQNPESIAVADPPRYSMPFLAALRRALRFPAPLYLPLIRPYSTLPLPKPIHTVLSFIPWEHRRRAIRQAQQALTDYLHTTRSIQFTFAEQISSNSIYALSNLIPRVGHFSLDTFADSFAKLLRYQRMNELEFFYESIGIHYKDVPSFLPAGQFFLTKEFRDFSVACVLSGFGVPWSRLGRLYRDEIWIFSEEPDKLNDRLLLLKSCGFKPSAVAGMCLAWPQLLRCESELGEDSGLMDYLKLANEFASCEQQDLDFWYEATSVLKVICDVGIERGDVHGVMRMCKNVFVDHSIECFVKQVEYFCKLGVEKKDVVMLLLERPEIGCFGLETSEFSVMGMLKHFGMSEAKLKLVVKKFPYVMGRNKMANLPCVMRALDLHNWFFKQLENGSNQLLSSYVLGDSIGDVMYRDGLEKILNSSCPAETMSKLKFLHKIGFGENKVTLRVLSRLQNNSTAIEESFKTYVDLGADYSRLCNSISRWPILLRQDMDTFTEILDFIVNEMGLSWSDFYKNPRCFHSDFDSRIKPRCKFYEWLGRKGVANRAFSLSLRVSESEERFIAHVYSIHPAAPKHYFECFAHTQLLRSSLSHSCSNLPMSASKTLSKIPCQHRLQVIEEAQQALTNYLHTTLSIHIDCAEEISKSSFYSLSNVISKIDFSVNTFSKRFIDSLHHHALDGLEFFYESIGVDYRDVRSMLLTDQNIFHDVGAVKVASALYEYGFPWQRLGEFCKDSVVIFSKESKQLIDRILYLEKCGFTKVAVIEMCLAFPELLHVESERDNVDLLLDDLKRVNGLTNGCYQTVDFWHDICKKIKTLYGICFQKGEVQNLTDTCISVFMDCSADTLVKKIDYFCNLGVAKWDVVTLLLKSPELLSFDLEKRKFCVLGFLKHFGMSEEEMNCVKQNFPYVLGKNRIANLPSVMRALDLHQWFFNQLKNGNEALLGNYRMEDPGTYTDEIYRTGLESSRSRTFSKLKFLHGVGFGENKWTMKLVPRLTSTHARLQDHFNCLINLGADFSEICRAINHEPRILNKKPRSTSQMVNYLINEIGLSMSDLFKFPAYLMTNLDGQIKPRHKFHKWLSESGLSTNRYSTSFLLSARERKYIVVLFRIHPAAPKCYLECFSVR